MHSVSLTVNQGRKQKSWISILMLSTSIALEHREVRWIKRKKTIITQSLFIAHYCRGTLLRYRDTLRRFYLYNSFSRNNNLPLTKRKLTISFRRNLSQTAVWNKYRFVFVDQLISPCMQGIMLVRKLLSVSRHGDFSQCHIWNKLGYFSFIVF